MTTVCHPSTLPGRPRSSPWRCHRPSSGSAMPRPGAWVAKSGWPAPPPAPLPPKVPRSVTVDGSPLPLRASSIFGVAFRYGLISPVHHPGRETASGRATRFIPLLSDPGDGHLSLRSHRGAAFCQIAERSLRRTRFAVWSEASVWVGHARHSVGGELVDRLHQSAVVAALRHRPVPLGDLFHGLKFPTSPPVSGKVPGLFSVGGSPWFRCMKFCCGEHG